MKVKDIIDEVSEIQEKIEVIDEILIEYVGKSYINITEEDKEHYATQLLCEGMEDLEQKLNSIMSMNIIEDKSKDICNVIERG
jgi:hypothetical protein